MATLETVMQLKQQGMPETQIIQTLQQQGISPREINEALSQSNIKNELAPGQAPINDMPPQGMPEQAPQGMQAMMSGQGPVNEMNPQMPPQGMPEQAPQGMQQSMMGTGQIPPAQPPIAQEMQAPEPYPPQEQMPYYEEYQPQQSSDIETINDIAEQIVEEKTTKIKKQITEVTRFKDELILEIEKINQRLTKVEDNFHQLQMAILGKIGEYGEDIKNISTEMQATQDSFSKMINPIIDEKRKETRAKPKTKKKSDDFESYLR
jgi:DNA-binding transcriptional MerR regulator